MEKSILVILVNTRKESAVKVQKILTEWGCLIKTRLGIHDGVPGDCSDTGLIVLELVGEKEKRAELKRKVGLLPGVHAELVEMSVKEK